jgi:hypothetical protein
MAEENLQIPAWRSLIKEVYVGFSARLRQLLVVQGTVVGTARQNIECSQLAAQLFQTQQ